jgi:hypothetical protein
VYFPTSEHFVLSFLWGIFAKKKEKKTTEILLNWENDHQVLFSKFKSGLRTVAGNISDKRSQQLNGEK